MSTQMAYFRPTLPNSCGNFCQLCTQNSDNLVGDAKTSGHCDAWAKATVRISLGTEILSLHYKIISIDVIIQCRFIRLIKNITTTSLLKLGNCL